MDLAREAKLKLAEERKRLAERASAQSKVIYNAFNKDSQHY